MSRGDNGSIFPSDLKPSPRSGGLFGFGSASMSGIDLDRYTAAVIHIESGGNPHAKARTSSASGLFQFVRSTWEDIMPGVPFSEAMNPGVATVAFEKLSRQNYDSLRSDLGRAPKEDELYMAHFAGPGTAARIIQADDNTPLARIFDHESMHANPFLAQLGTAGRYRDWLHDKYERAANEQHGPAKEQKGGGLFASLFGWGSAEASPTQLGDLPPQKTPHVAQSTHDFAAGKR